MVGYGVKLLDIITIAALRLTLPIAALRLTLLIAALRLTLLGLLCYGLTNALRI